MGARSLTMSLVFDTYESKADVSQATGLAGRADGGAGGALALRAGGAAAARRVRLGQLPQLPRGHHPDEPEVHPLHRRRDARPGHGQITLQEVPRETAKNQPKGQNPTSVARGARKAPRRAARGHDRLDRLRRAGRPHAWRILADANGLDDPRRLRPGQVLLIPEECRGMLGARRAPRRPPCASSAPGRTSPPPEMAQVLDVTIEQDLVLPDAFAIRFRDTDQRPGRTSSRCLRRSSTATASPSAPRWRSSRPGGRPPISILKGEIAPLEARRPGRQRARASPCAATTPAYRLHRERKSRTFLNVSDADLVRKIAQEHGLSAPARPPAASSSPHLPGQPDGLGVLRTRAYRIGYELFVRDRRSTSASPQSRDAARGGVPVYPAPPARCASPRRARCPRCRSRAGTPRPSGRSSGQASRAPPRSPSIGETRTGSAMAQHAGHRQVRRLRPGGDDAGPGDPSWPSPSSTRSPASSSTWKAPASAIRRSSRASNPGQQGRPKRFSGSTTSPAATHKITPDQGYLTHFVVSGRRPLDR